MCYINTVFVCVYHTYTVYLYRYITFMQLQL